MTPVGMRWRTTIRPRRGEQDRFGIHGSALRLSFSAYDDAPKSLFALASAGTILLPPVVTISAEETA